MGIFHSTTPGFTCGEKGVLCWSHLSENSTEKNLHPESARSLKYITKLQQLSLWDSILLYVLVLLPRSMAEKQGC
jgi:hypothetical protein